jgi:hypothetical protein
MLQRLYARALNFGFCFCLLMRQVFAIDAPAVIGSVQRHPGKGSACLSRGLVVFGLSTKGE